MGEYVLNRDLAVSSIKGHTVVFKKDQPTYVPDELVSEVMEKGGVPVDGKPKAEPEADNQPPEGEEREARIQEALVQIRDGDDREAFTAAGKPSVKYVSEMVGFKVSSDETAPLWEAVSAEKNGEG